MGSFFFGGGVAYKSLRYKCLDEIRGYAYCKLKQGPRPMVRIRGAKGSVGGFADWGLVVFRVPKRRARRYSCPRHAKRFATQAFEETLNPK